MGSSHGRSSRCFNVVPERLHDHNSTIECSQRHRFQHATLHQTFRTCCSPAPCTSFTPWKFCSMAERSATLSSIISGDTFGSVQKKATHSAVQHHPSRRPAMSMSAAMCQRDLIPPVLARTAPARAFCGYRDIKQRRVFSQAADHHRPRRLHSFQKRSLSVRSIGDHHYTFAKPAFKQRNAPFHKLGSQFQLGAKLPRGLANSFRDLQILLADIHQSQRSHRKAERLVVNRTSRHRERLQDFWSRVECLCN